MRPPLRPSALLLVFAALALCMPVLRAQDNIEIHNGYKVAAREAIVRFEGMTPGWLQRLWRDHDLDSAKPVGRLKQVYRLHSRSKKLAVLLQQLRNAEGVVYAEPNYIIDVIGEPNDPRFVELWGLQNTGQSFGYSPGTPGADISAASAWNISTGSSDEVVAVIDTGIDYTHPDLAANVWSAPSDFSVVIAGQTITCPAGSHGFNAITNSCDPMDDHGHGTHVSGTIGAAGNNGLGVVGVNWTTKLIGAKFLDSSGSGTAADAIEAIEFLVQAKQAFAPTKSANIRVVSNSWGGGGYSQALADEIQHAADNDMLFVFAAGNNGSNNDVMPFYPAAYNLPSLIAVAATDNNDNRASFSNYGAGSVHLGAPGVSILSTIPGGNYQLMSGTSMATPHVSGAAALVLSRCPLSTSSLKADLLNNVDNIASMTGITVSGGRLNVDKALQACTAPVSLSPAAVSFGNQNLNTTSGPRTVTLTNNQTTPLTVVSIAATGDFAQTNACPTSLAPGTNCAITVTFTPRTAGSLSGALTVTDDAPNSPQISALSGIGYVPPPVTLAPDALDFGSVPIGSTSAPKQVVLTNNQTQTPLHIVSIVISGDFNQSNNCGSTVAGSGSCTITVTFTPSAVGNRSGSLTVSHDASNSPQSISLQGSGAGLPDLVETAASLTGPLAAGVSVQVSDTVLNQGTGNAGNSYTGYYLSTTPNKTSSSVLLGTSRSVPALPSGASSSGLATVMIPLNTAAGSYYVLACADQYNYVRESDETNNCVATAAPLPMGLPDLVESSLSVPGPLAAGVAVQISDTVMNQGTGNAAASYTGYYLSTTPAKTGSSVLLGTNRSVPALAASATSSGVATVTIPLNTAAGSYYLIACADQYNYSKESDETNNCLATSAPLPMGMPDLVESSVNPLGPLAAGIAVQISDTVLNQGAGNAASSYTAYYLSTTLSKSGSSVQLGATRSVPALAAGASSSGAATVTIPLNTAPGSYYLIACADQYNYVKETDETNNCVATSAPLPVGVPDLVETSVSVPQTLTAGAAAQLSDTLLNQGSGNAAASYTGYYLSTTPTKSGSSVQLGATRSVSALPSGASSAGTTMVTIPASTAAGSYYLIACADQYNYVKEADETNNCLASAPVSVSH